MDTKNNKSPIHALEFDCQTPIKFYEHCSNCPKFDNGKCPDLALLMKILSGKKKLVYNGYLQEKDSIHVTDFTCQYPVKYFEKTRNMCPHMGRCREEGLLLALLKGKKELTYGQKEVYELKKPIIKKIREKEQRNMAQAIK